VIPQVAYSHDGVEGQGEVEAGIENRCESAEMPVVLYAEKIGLDADADSNAFLAIIGNCAAQGEKGGNQQQRQLVVTELAAIADQLYGQAVVFAKRWKENQADQ
jgi:hypothetical protein